MLSDAARHRFMVATPLLFALLLTLLHPIGGDTFYEAISADTDRWIAVHVVGVVFFPAMAAVVWQLLRGLPGRAARIGRLALVPYALFYTAYEVVVGLATGVLVHAGQPAGPVDALLADPIVGEPGIFNVVGSLGWIAAIVAAVVARRAAGASTPSLALIALGGAMVAHVPPFGPVALVALSAGIHLAVRRRERLAAVPAV